MKTHSTLVLLLAAACTPPIADSGTEDDSDTSVVPSVCSEAASDDVFSSVSVPEATYVCTQSGCTLTLPSSFPGRQFDPIVVGGVVTVTLGVEQNEYVVASEDGVFVVDLEQYLPLHIGSDGLLWIPGDGAVLSVSPTGDVVQRCDTPPELDFVSAVTERAGVVWLAGVINEREGVLYKLVNDAWQAQPTTIWVEGFEPYGEQDVIALGYGYAEVHSPDRTESTQIGGSDDDFTAAAVCADGNYWVGGQTGLYMYCTPDHQCARTGEGNYPFQSTSYGCDADNHLWWLEPGQQAGDPRTVATLTQEGVRTDQVLEDGIRHRRTQAGRTWEIRDLVE